MTFKPGDRVMLVEPRVGLEVGDTYTINAVYDDGTVDVKEALGMFYTADRFEPVSYVDDMVSAIYKLAKHVPEEWIQISIKVEKK